MPKGFSLSEVILNQERTECLIHEILWRRKVSFKAYPP
jgi:hypothetical protein